MEDETSKDSNVKSTVEAVTGLVKAIPVYQDTVQPAAQQIGKSLETITKTVNIALAPIKALVWGYEQIEGFITKHVSEKLKNVPQENIITPPPQIAGPAIEALRFSGHDETLRELYANLVATSMNKITTSKAHPGYVDIIKNITPDEARLLKVFATETSIPLVDVKALAPVSNSDKGFIIALPNFSKLMSDGFLENPQMFSTYINNLCRLGLLQIPHGLEFSDSSFYNELENHALLDSLKEKIKASNRSEIEFVRKVVEITSYGKQFLENVVVDKDVNIINQ